MKILTKWVFLLFLVSGYLFAQDEKFAKMERYKNNYIAGMVIGSLLGLGIGNFIVGDVGAGIGYFFGDVVGAGSIVGGIILMRTKVTRQPIGEQIFHSVDRTLYIAGISIIGIGGGLLFFLRIAQLTNIHRRYRENLIIGAKEEIKRHYVASRQDYLGYWSIGEFSKAF